MLTTIFQRLFQRLGLLVVVAIILVAAYVSLGRQLMPTLSQRADYFEQQIYQQFGIPVSFNALAGSFRGFNPIITIDGLRVAVSAEPRQDSRPDRAASDALFFSRATIELDVPQSLWQWRWILRQVSVEGLELEAEQNATGGWQLRGLELGTTPVNLDSLYQTLLRFSQLHLHNVTLSAQTHSGESLTLSDGSLAFQNRGEKNLLHIDANLGANPQPLSLSLEARGEELAELTGRLHVVVPPADYTTLTTLADFSTLLPEPVSIGELLGGAKLWLDLSAGELLAANAELALDRLLFTAGDSEPLLLTGVTGSSEVTAEPSGGFWNVDLRDFTLNLGDESWRDFNANLHLVPDTELTARVDQINLALLADMALDSGLLNAQTQTELTAYDLDGTLQNFSLSWPLATDNPETIEASANLLDVHLGSVRNSPNMWGLTGYLGIGFDPAARRILGTAEIESENFRINIPNTFTRVWGYDYVNGRLHIDVDITDGERTRLTSSNVTVRSASIDANVQFDSLVHRKPDGQREASLELLVGARRVDIADKSLYLPDGPGNDQDLLDSMEFIDRALVDGDIHESGVLFRGNSLSDAPTVTRTFQSFFNLANGTLDFSEEWPPLEALLGLVVTDDDNVDIAVVEGVSQGLNLRDVTGRIRPDVNAANWLRVSGQAAGSTAGGLAYLQQTPVNADLRETFSTWQATGDLEADVEVIIPLNQENTEPDVRLQIALEDNQLTIPDYDLAVANLTGPVLFDTRTGLEPSTLQAQVFGDTASLRLSSEFSDGEMTTILIDATGQTTPEALIAWPQPGDLAHSLLAHIDGSLAYGLQMRLDQTSSDTINNTLSVKSDLLGAAITMPEPLAKDAATAVDLNLHLEFTENGLKMDGNLGPNLRWEGIETVDDEILGGLLTLGVTPEDALKLRDAAATGLPGATMEVAPEVRFAKENGSLFMGVATEQVQALEHDAGGGLVIAANLANFDLEPWTDFVSTLIAYGDATSDQGQGIAFIDVTTDQFSLYGQELPEVSFRLTPDPRNAGWFTKVESDSVQGTLLIPYNKGDLLDVNLDFLHLPDDTGTLAQTSDPGAGVVEANGVCSRDEPESASSAGTANSAGSAGEVASADETESALAESPEERIDPLQYLDPRELPAMKVNLCDFTIAGRQFGEWHFTLNPTDDGAKVTDLSFDFRGLRMGMDAPDKGSPEPSFYWRYDGEQHRSKLSGNLVATNIREVLEANGYAPSLESEKANFKTKVNWPGSPAFFSGDNLSGTIELRVEDGRFLRNSDGQGTLRLVSLINLTAIVQRLRISDDLLLRGLAFDEITGHFTLDQGMMHIDERLVISGPSSLYQITGDVDIAQESIEGELYVTLPVSNNLPWIGLLTSNLPLAFGAYLFDQIFGDQVDSLSSAVYTLSGPIEELEPEFKQAFGSPDTAPSNPQTPPTQTQPPQ